VFSLEKVLLEDVKTIFIGYWLCKILEREKIECNLQ